MYLDSCHHHQHSGSAPVSPPRNYTLLQGPSLEPGDCSSSQSTQSSGYGSVQGGAGELGPVVSDVDRDITSIFIRHRGHGRRDPQATPAPPRGRPQPRPRPYGGAARPRARGVHPVPHRQTLHHLRLLDPGCGVLRPWIILALGGSGLTADLLAGLGWEIYEARGTFASLKNIWGY